MSRYGSIFLFILPIYTLLSQLNTFDIINVSYVLSAKFMIIYIYVSMILYQAIFNEI